MLKIVLKNKIRVVLILVSIFLLVGVRAYESTLFYDPFILYFKGDFNTIPYPPYDFVALIVGLLFRYSLNASLSVVIIYLLFQDKSMIKFVSLLYLFFFIFLIILFFTIIYFNDSHNSWLLFYVRRFLIQPLFLLLFVPAFYYQRTVRNL